jgi:hypothetical protein
MSIWLSITSQSLSTLPSVYQFSNQQMKGIYHNVLKKEEKEKEDGALVAHACNLSYSGGRD